MRQRYGLVQTVAPTEEVIPVDEAREFLRLDTTDYDTLLQGLILAAVEQLETVTRRKLALATYELTLDAWPCDNVIEVPFVPVVSVDTITYLDTAGTSTELDASAYRVDTASLLPRITPAYNTSWPSIQDVTNAITIELQAGYSAATVPELAKVAVKMLVSDLFEHPEAQVEMRLTENRTLQRLITSLAIKDFV